MKWFIEGDYFVVVLVWRSCWIDHNTACVGDEISRRCPESVPGKLIRHLGAISRHAQILLSFQIQLDGKVKIVSHNMLAERCNLSEKTNYSIQIPPEIFRLDLACLKCPRELW